MQIVTFTPAAAGLMRPLAISLLLHLLLLWPSFPAWRETAAAPPLTAILQPPVIAPTPALSLPAQKRSLSPLSKKGDTETPMPAPAMTTTEPVPINNPSTTTEVSRSENPAATSAPVIPSALPPADGIDAEGLRAYRLALAREARRHKRYPPAAIDAGWSGTAELRVMVRAGGTAEGAQLARSSGHAVLDEAALEMLRLALPATAVPASLRERAFVVSLPVVFELPE